MSSTRRRVAASCLRSAASHCYWGKRAFRSGVAGQYLHGHDIFLKRIGGAYNAFVSKTEKAVRAKCKEDLLCTTRYITWSLHTRNGFALKSLLGEARPLLATCRCSEFALLGGLQLAGGMSLPSDPLWHTGVRRARRRARRRLVHAAQRAGPPRVGRPRRPALEPRAWLRLGGGGDHARAPALWRHPRLPRAGAPRRPFC